MKNSETIIDTKSVAELAKISFSKDELHCFEEDMKKIVSFAKKVSCAELCADSGEEELKNVFRNDVPSQRFKRKKLLSVAPKNSTDDEYFSVPRVVE